MQFTIQIQPSNIEFKSDENLLEDALSQSIHLEHSCKTGDCGMCSAEIISGLVQNKLGEIIEQGHVLTCQSKAMSNMVIKANYYPELAHIKLQTFPCKVAKFTYVTDDIVSLTFRLPPTAKIDYLAGQYVDLSFQGIKRSYSIANACKGTNEIELHIRKVPDGLMSNLIFGRVRDNQLMRMEGPKGTFFVRTNNKPLVLLATGTGIAPIKAIVEDLVHSQDPRPIHIYWGMQYKTELYCSEIIKLANDYNHITFRAVLSRENDGQAFSGYVQDAVCQDFESLENIEVYACGSLKMIEASKAKFLSKSLPPESFHSDAFTPAKQI
ncbi:MAG: CDP-6-deoxy-delta-3,4-glucoseen reductase [Shewanella oneidensis]|nr:MAG: CDP-6-deoxy-delta-3,4-glucoseen reductase [Shewanella oneidensis]